MIACGELIMEQKYVARSEFESELWIDLELD